MKRLPALDIPDGTPSSKAYEWAYRIGTLPFDSTVHDVAMLVEAIIAEAKRPQETPSHE